MSFFSKLLSRRFLERGYCFYHFLLDQASLSLLGLGLWWRCHSLSRKCHDEINLFVTVPTTLHRSNRHCKLLDKVSTPLLFETCHVLRNNRSSGFADIYQRNLLYQRYVNLHDERSLIFEFSI